MHKINEILHLMGFSYRELLTKSNYLPTYLGTLTVLAFSKSACKLVALTLLYTYILFEIKIEKVRYADHMTYQ